MDLKQYAQKVAELRKWQEAEKLARRKGQKAAAVYAVAQLIDLEEEVDKQTAEILSAEKVNTQTNLF